MLDRAPPWPGKRAGGSVWLRWEEPCGSRKKMKEENQLTRRTGKQIFRTNVFLVAVCIHLKTLRENG